MLADQFLFRMLWPGLNRTESFVSNSGMTAFLFYGSLGYFEKELRNSAPRRIDPLRRASDEWIFWELVSKCNGR